MADRNERRFVVLVTHGEASRARTNVLCFTQELERAVTSATTLMRGALNHYAFFPGNKVAVYELEQDAFYSPKDLEHSGDQTPKGHALLSMFILGPDGWHQVVASEIIPKELGDRIAKSLELTARL